MDQMLKDDAYHNELDEMRGGKGGEGPAPEGSLSGEKSSKAEDEDGGIVSTAEAVDMLKRLMQVSSRLVCSPQQSMRAAPFLVHEIGSEENVIEVQKDQLCS